MAFEDKCYVWDYISNLHITEHICLTFCQLSVIILDRIHAIRVNMGKTWLNMCSIGVRNYCNRIWSRRDSVILVVEFTTIYAITTKLVRSNHVHNGIYSIQHYVIKFVSDLQQVGGFLRVFRFPPPIKLITSIKLKYC